MKSISNHKYLAKCITSLTLLCFTYTFILHQAAMGITMLVTENREAQQFDNSNIQLLVPSRYGRITSGQFNSDKRLVIYIQDLHCNPEVQKNIFNIEQLLDSKYGVKKIFVEGAPCGKLDTSLLSSIPDENIRTKTIDSLLRKGLLSGSEYYALKSKQDKLYGLEEWGTYRANLDRYRKVSESKEENEKINQDLAAKIERLKETYLDWKLKRIEKVFKGEQKESRYLKIEKLGERVEEVVTGYPNLSRYIEMIKVNHGIKHQRLNEELTQYIKELKRTVPMKVYLSLTEKMRESNNLDEYYQKLVDIAAVYNPNLQKRFPEISRFFDYLRLNTEINPVYLVEEESLFQDRVMTKYADRLLDKELILMSRMAKDFRNYVSLNMTPNQYRYFAENKETFKILLQKYFNLEEVKPSLALLDNEELNQFYVVNFQRNDIFIKNIASSSPESQAPKYSLDSNGFSSVAEHISQFKDIDIVVAGGFHLDIGKALKDMGASYLTITPNVTQKMDESVYEQVMRGKIDLQKMQSSALAPILITLLKLQGRETEFNALMALLDQFLSSQATTGKTIDDMIKGTNQWLVANEFKEVKVERDTVEINKMDVRVTIDSTEHLMFALQVTGNNEVTFIQKREKVRLPTTQDKIQAVKTFVSQRVILRLGEISSAITNLVSPVKSVDTLDNIPLTANISNHHVHLSEEDVEKLFGKGYVLKWKRDLMQLGQYVCEEMVTIEGPKGEIKNVRILGPVRPRTQVEISETDSRILGLRAPVRLSGDLEGSGPITIKGPHDTAILSEGSIVAKRHVHMAEADAVKWGIKNEEVVSIETHGSRGRMTFGDVVVRVSKKFATEVHFDTDEGNAAGITNGATVTLIRSVKKNQFPSNLTHITVIPAGLSAITADRTPLAASGVNNDAHLSVDAWLREQVAAFRFGVSYAEKNTVQLILP
ncbi:MAG: phosphate propanoyltransferase, partial [Endomicrobiales bacterium]